VPPPRAYCNVTVSVVPTLTAPVITLCANATVPERQPAGTSYGRIISATASAGGTIAFSVSSSTSSPTPGASFPFAVSCDGVLTNTRTALAGVASSYAITLRADNIGTDQTYTSFCNATVTVVPAPVPPSLTTSVLYAYDLIPNGTWIGNVGAVDNNNVVAGAPVVYVARTAFAARDAADDFVIDAAGNVTVKRGATLDATVKAVYTGYSVNVSDAVSSAVYPITINLLLSARPPVTADAARSTLDTAKPGARLLPALAASHPQNKALAFSLYDATGTFAVNATTGVVSLRPDAGALDVNVQASYVLPFTVTDADGRTASAYLTVTVVETNRPPYFPAPSYALTVPEGALGGAALQPPVSAADPNLRDSLAYRITM
jgi:hypothetical protein